MNILIVNYHYVGAENYPFPGVNGISMRSFVLKFKQTEI